MLIGHKRSPRACFLSASLLADTITFADLERRSRPSLFRGLQHRRELRSSQPAIEKSLQPRTLGHVIDGAVGEVVMAGARARRLEAIMAAHGEAGHHRVCYAGGGRGDGTKGRSEWPDREV